MRYLIPFILSFAGCSHIQRVDSALDQIEESSVAVAAHLDAIAAKWQEAVDARVRYCEARLLDTQAQREDCLGPALDAMDALEDFKKITEHQEHIGRSASEIRKFVEQLNRTLDTIQDHN